MFMYINMEKGHIAEDPGGLDTKPGIKSIVSASQKTDTKTTALVLLLSNVHSECRTEHVLVLTALT